MALQTEIKDFTKKVLLLGIVLSFLVNLVFTYVSSLSGEQAPMQLEMMENSAEQVFHILEILEWQLL